MFSRLQRFFFFFRPMEGRRSWKVEVAGGWIFDSLPPFVSFFSRPRTISCNFFSNFLTTSEPPPPLFIFGRRPCTKAARNLHAAMPAHLCVFPFSLAVGSSLSAGKPRSRAKFVFLSPCRVLQSRFFHDSFTVMAGLRLFSATIPPGSPA